jgi:hypothetical protein
MVIGLQTTRYKKAYDLGAETRLTYINPGCRVFFDPDQENRRFPEKLIDIHEMLA